MECYLISFNMQFEFASQESKREVFGQNWPTYCLKVYLNELKTGQTARYLCDIPQWGLQLCFGPFWGTEGRKLPFLPVEGII